MSKLWLGVLLAVCLVTLVLGQGKDKDGKGKDRKDMPPGGCISNTEEDARCVDERLEGLSEDQIGKIRAVEATPDTLSDLLPFICKIPEACLRRLDCMVPRNETLEASAIMGVLCDDECSESRNMEGVISVLIRRYNKTKLCEDIIEPTLTKKASPSDECELGYFGFSSLIKMSQRGDQKCMNIPDLYKIFWAKNLLKDVLKGMTNEQFIDFLEVIGAKKEIISQVPCGNIKEIGQVFQEKNILTLNLANLDIFQKLVPLIPLMPGEMCKTIPYTLLQAVGVEQLKELDWRCPAQGRGQDSMCGRGDDDDDDSGEKGMGGKPRHPGKGGPGNGDMQKCEFKCGLELTKTIITGIKAADASFGIGQYKDRLGKLSCCVGAREILGGLTPGKCGMSERPTSSKLVKDAVKMCKPQKASKDMSKKEIVDLGCFIMDVFKREDIDDISEADLCDSTVKELIKKCTAEKVGKSSRDKIKRLRAAFAKKCLPADITQSVIDDVGTAIYEANCTQAKSANVMNLPNIETEDITPSKLGCWIKAIKTLKAEDVAENEAALATQDVDKFAEKAKQAKTQILDRVDRIRFRRAMLEAVLEKFLEVYDKKISELTEEQISGLARIIEGLTPKQISEIPDDKKNAIYDQVCQWEGLRQRQVRALTKMFTDYLSGLDIDNPLAELTASRIDSLSDTCLTGFAPNANNLSTEALAAFCKRMGNMGTEKWMAFIKSEHRKDVANTCFGIRGELDGSFGSLVPFSSKENLDMLSPMDFLNIPSSAMQCTMKNVTEYVIAKLATLSEADITEVTLWIAAAQPEYVTTDVSMGDELSELLDELPDSEICARKMAEEAKTYFGNIINDLTTRLSTASGAGSTRRRRAATAPTCADLVSYSNEALLEFDAADFAAITSFTSDCVAKFGTVEWSMEQAAEARKQYNEYLYGRDICDLTVDELKEIGSIGYSMTVTEIKCLKNLNEEALTELGARQNWSPEQGKALLDRYMELANKTPFAYNTMDSSELTAAGHILCSLTKEDSSKIDPAKYKDVAKLLGGTSITKCKIEALQGLYEVATHDNAYGDVKDWTTSRIEDVGIVAAAIPADKISELTVEHIQNLINSALAHMPAETLQEFDKDMLLGLDETQLAFVDDDDFSDDQKKILDGDDGKTSGGRTVVVSCVSLLLALLTCFIT